ncbi:unnamed protein product [Musa acuminata var. zebrina]
MKSKSFQSYVTCYFSVWQISTDSLIPTAPSPFTRGSKLVLHVAFPIWHSIVA